MKVKSLASYQKPKKKYILASMISYFPFLILVSYLKVKG